MGETTLFDGLPSFDRPPVVEVAVGVYFLQLPDLTAVALVRLIDDLWQSGFPRIVEQPGAPPLSAPGRPPAIAFQLQTGIPPMRLWSLTEDETSLIQVQHDRLLLNWRKIKDDDPYPRYRRLHEDFARIWREFSNYVEDRDYGVLQPSVAEVSFFNRVPMSDAAEIPIFVKALNPEWSIDGELASADQPHPRDVAHTLIVDCGMSKRANRDARELIAATAVIVHAGDAGEPVVGSG